MSGLLWLKAREDKAMFYLIHSDDESAARGIRHSNDVLRQFAARLLLSPTARCLVIEVPRLYSTVHQRMMSAFDISHLQGFVP